MRNRKLSVGFVTLAILAAGLLGIGPRAAAQKEEILHSFHGTDGSGPSASLIFDAAGNLYGTTELGGTGLCTGGGCGTVFELSPKTGGGWSEKVLHSFHDNGVDGYSPMAAVILDGGGNIYGTTFSGGAYGGGTVFELILTEGEGWKENVLYDFGNGTDGGGPSASLIFDGAGNLYGTTTGGGAYGVGTVFELSPQAGADWSEKVLHSFDDNGEDGYSPVASVVFDHAGNLYGTTFEGGFSVFSIGTAFELTPEVGGGWSEKILHQFIDGPYNNHDGNFVYAGLILDATGDLYGTTFGGGCCNKHYGGTVFELSLRDSGNWGERIIHNFSSTEPQTGPQAGVIMDAVGNLYGTTVLDGTGSCVSGTGVTVGCGTVFELGPNRRGGWVERILHSFDQDGTDGLYPTAGLIFDAAGDLYGTTPTGGTAGFGTVFRVKP
jgi:uncharacterized repeat protein (TIGR03803 family)